MNAKRRDGKVVKGVNVDSETRCEHWHSELDIIAIKFRCCGEYYSCFDCHAALVGHPPVTWPAEAFQEHAVLCGACDFELTIEDYFASGNKCPNCAAAFNPNCERHYHLYFG